MQRIVVIVERVVLVFARKALRYGQGLVDRGDDVFVVGICEVIEELERLLRTDAGGGVDRCQQQGLLGLPRVD